MYRIPLIIQRCAGATLLLHALIGTSPADTIVLKTGERLEAKITKSTETSVEAEVKMSSSITDIRVINRADIVSIEKPDPAEADYATALQVGPGANSRSAADYDTAIRTQLNPFLVRHPNSPRASQIKELIETLKKEKDRVAAGEVKIEGIWYTPVELDKQKDQVNATLLYQQMKSLVQSGDMLAALNVFAKLEKTYPGARSYPDAVEYALSLIPGVQIEINTRKTIFANDAIERKKGLESLPDFRRAPLIAAAAAEEAKTSAALEAALKMGTKWTPIYPRNQKSIEELQKTVTAETTRLSAINTAAMKASIAAVDETKKLIASGDVAGATVSLQKATTLWSTNALLKDTTAELAQAKITPTPTPTPPPPLNALPKSLATPTPSPTATAKPPK